MKATVLYKIINKCSISWVVNPKVNSLIIWNKLIMNDKVHPKGNDAFVFWTSKIFMGTVMWSLTLFINPKIINTNSARFLLEITGFYCYNVFIRYTIFWIQHVDSILHITVIRYIKLRLNRVVIYRGCLKGRCTSKRHIDFQIKDGNNCSYLWKTVWYFDVSVYFYTKIFEMW